MGRGRRDDRGPVHRDCRLARRAGGHLPLQLRRHDGPAQLRRHGPPVLQPPRRVAARSHAVLVGGEGGHQDLAGRQRRHGPRAGRRLAAHPDLGVEPDHLEPALLVARAGGQAARRPGGGDRPLSQPDGGEGDRSPSRAAGHRRGARPGDDARHHQRRAARRRLRGPLHAGLRGAHRAGAGLPARSRGRHLRDRCGRDRRARPRLRHHSTGGDSRELRPAAPPGRRCGGARHHLPAGAGRGLARGGRRRAAEHRRFLRHEPAGARASRPDSWQSADDQHQLDRRRAARGQRRRFVLSSFTTPTR